MNFTYSTSFSIFDNRAQGVRDSFIHKKYISSMIYNLGMYTTKITLKS